MVITDSTASAAQTSAFETVSGPRAPCCGPGTSADDDGVDRLVVVPSPSWPLVFWPPRIERAVACQRVAAEVVCRDGDDVGGVLRWIGVLANEHDVGCR